MREFRYLPRVEQQSTSRDSLHLALSEDVFFCVSEGQGIFLDMVRDNYSAVPIPARQSADGGELTDNMLFEIFAPHMGDLIEAGLLRLAAKGEAGFQAYRSIVGPRRHIFGDDDQRAFGFGGLKSKSARVTIGDIRRFLSASFRAARLLKTRPIQDVVRMVRLRKIGSVATNGDAEALARQVTVFRCLRPWYPASYLCLYDALALIEFLAPKKLFPTWVFGVQAQPFGAHCWLQAGDQLLNESIEYAGQFTPIMTV